VQAVVLYVLPGLERLRRVQDLLGLLRHRSRHATVIDVHETVGRARRTTAAETLVSYELPARDRCHVAIVHLEPTASRWNVDEGVVVAALGLAEVYHDGVQVVGIVGERRTQSSELLTCVVDLALPSLEVRPQGRDVELEHPLRHGQLLGQAVGSKELLAMRVEVVHRDHRL